MKVLVDMNLSPRWIDVLSRSQFHAAHWSSVGRHEALDAEIMSYAAQHDYIVLTNDLDFSAILAVTHREKPSVVQIRSGNLSPDFIGPQVINALHQLEEPLQDGALVVVEPLRTRLRVLPLKPQE